MSFEDAIDAPEVKVRSVCAVDGCGRFVQWRQWCCTHYARWLRTGIAGGAIKPLGPRGAGHLNKQGRVMMDVGGKKVMQHTVIATQALGKPMPPGAVVHHIDQNPSNNHPSNLVICPNEAYHKLLHQRQRAFDASGHYHWRRCTLCKQYDDPANDMWISRKKAHHRACDNARAAAYKAQRKEANAV